MIFAILLFVYLLFRLNNCEYITFTHDQVIIPVNADLSTGVFAVQYGVSYVSAASGITTTRSASGLMDRLFFLAMSCSVLVLGLNEFERSGIVTNYAIRHFLSEWHSIS
jgi:hypothetical protein